MCACVEETTEIFQLLLRIWLDKTRLIKSKVFSYLLFTLHSSLKCLHLCGHCVLPCWGSEQVSQGKSLSLRGWTQLCSGPSCLVSASCAWSVAAAAVMAKIERPDIIKGRMKRNEEEPLVQLDDQKLQLEPEAHGGISGGIWFQTLQRYMWSQNTLREQWLLSVSTRRRTPEILQRQEAQALWAVGQDDMLLVTQANQEQSLRPKPIKKGNKKLYPTQRFTVRS